MLSVTLANSAITTSRLGFGCVSLTMHGDRDAAHRVLSKNTCQLLPLLAS